MGGLVSYLGAIRQALRRQTPRRWSVIATYTRLRLGVMLRRRQANGMKVLGMRLVLTDVPGFTFMFEEIFLRGDYRFEARSSAPTIIDAGANVGAAVLYFKTLYPEASIAAFEPDPSVFEALRTNVEVNGLAGITLHQAAVGGEPGRANLGGERRHGEVGGSGEIEVVRLSDHIEGRVDFLKLDVEGAETSVISELAESGKLGSIEQMAIEYHHHLSDAGDSLSVILGMLEEAGFGYSLAARAPTYAHEYQDVLIRAYSLAPFAGGKELRAGGTEIQ